MKNIDHISSFLELWLRRLQHVWFSFYFLVLVILGQTLRLLAVFEVDGLQGLSCKGQSLVIHLDVVLHIHIQFLFVLFYHCPCQKEIIWPFSLHYCYLPMLIRIMVLNSILSIPMLTQILASSFIFSHFLYYTL